MERQVEKKYSIARILTWQYVKTSACVFLLGFCVLFLLQIYDMVIRSKMNVNVYHASKLIQEDYHQIDTSGIEEKGGSVEVVTPNLEVIHLVGEGCIKEKKMTMTRWCDYMAEFGRMQVSASKYEVSFAYEEQAKYWLVVSFPASIEIQISACMNPEAMDYKQELIWVIGGIVIYLMMTIIIILFLSQRNSKCFVKPLKELEAYTNVLERGIYHERMDQKFLGEFGVLQEAFHQLAHKLEQKTRENEDMRQARKEMILGISHDLKNPLTVIQAYLEVLNNDKVAEEKRKHYLRVMIQNSHRANDILNQLFEFAKLDGEKLKLDTKVVDFCEFVRQQLLNDVDEIELHEIEVAYSIPEEEWFVRIDELQMQRVWSNLIGNALKYMECGGKIQIDVHQIKEEVYLEIIDNGVGMTKEEAKKVFEPFVRNDKARNSKTGGSGLGLAIVKQIVEAHKGSITLEAEVQRGCHFIIKLPMIKKEC